MFNSHVQLNFGKLVELNDLVLFLRVMVVAQVVPHCTSHLGVTSSISTGSLAFLSLSLSISGVPSKRSLVEVPDYWYSTLQEKRRQDIAVQLEAKQD